MIDEKGFTLYCEFREIIIIIIIIIIILYC